MERGEEEVRVGKGRREGEKWRKKGGGLKKRPWKEDFGSSQKGRGK